jgi:hypothetical protein
MKLLTPALRRSLAEYAHTAALALAPLAVPAIACLLVG